MAEKLKCSVCGAEATVHLTQIVNNKIQKVDLCESCAQKKGVTDSEGFSLSDLLSKTNFTPEQHEEEERGGCPTCGHRAIDFQKTGRLGCPDCYVRFKSLIEPVLEDMHPGTKHKGKVPKIALRRRSGEAELRSLREALAKAIEEEAYEDAARYRDKIKAVEEAMEKEEEPANQ